MTIIKKYFLCALMLNTVCLSAMISMGHDAGRMMIEFRKRQEEQDKVDDFSPYTHEILVEKIRDRIDLRHLGIGRYVCCRSITGSIASYYKTINISPEKATEELNTILSYIPENNENTKAILKTLIKKHRYVNYLIETLIQKKIEEFKEVKGSTIDGLGTPNHSNGIYCLNCTVHDNAHSSFFYNLNLINELEAPHREFADIHFTALYGHTNKINPFSLQMSSHSTYLKSKDQHGNKIIWLMKTGEQIELTKERRKKIQWSSGKVPAYMQPCAMDTKNNYYATAIQSWFTRLVKIEKDKPAIFLYKCPEKISYICQRAYENNLNNREELIALQNSQSLKAIEGYPRQNLENLIKERINLLQ